MRVLSDLAVRGLLSQGVDDFGEGGALLQAERPAAGHEFVDFGGTSVRQGQLQLPCLQTCRAVEQREGRGLKQVVDYKGHSLRLQH